MGSLPGTTRKCSSALPSICQLKLEHTRVKSAAIPWRQVKGDDSSKIMGARGVGAGLAGFLAGGNVKPRSLSKFKWAFVLRGSCIVLEPCSELILILYWEVPLRPV